MDARHISKRIDTKKLFLHREDRLIPAYFDRVKFFRDLCFVLNGNSIVLDSTILVNHNEPYCRKLDAIDISIVRVFKHTETRELPD